MTKNNRSGTNNNQHLKDHLYDSTIGQYSSDERKSDTWIDDIHLFVGSIIVVLFILCVIVMMIGKFKKFYQKIEQTEPFIPTVPMLQRYSSVRNPYSPNRPSSLDIRFQMESRERRQSQLYLILLTNRAT